MDKISRISELCEQAGVDVEESEEGLFCHTEDLSMFVDKESDEFSFEKGKMSYTGVPDEINIDEDTDPGYIGINDGEDHILITIPKSRQKEHPKLP